MSIIENITLRILLKEARQSIASPGKARSLRRSRNFWPLVSTILLSVGGGVPSASSGCKLIIMGTSALSVTYPASLCERTGERKPSRPVKAHRLEARLRALVLLPRIIGRVAVSAKTHGCLTRRTLICGFRVRYVGQMSQRRCETSENLMIGEDLSEHNVGERALVAL